VLVTAHRHALADDVRADDDCALVERLGLEVQVVMGDPANLKVTRPADLDAVGAALRARMSPGVHIEREQP
jgi:2-C-methyl-D-erythritol 4-phosphate cytidylyltransferase